MTGISGFQLKWIGIVTMAIDHIGHVLFPQCWMLRVIGRLAFPIFCFLLVEGFHYTHDRKRYALRLAAFAVISELPFNIAIFGNWFVPQHQNVFWTLTIGVLMMTVLEYIDEKQSEAAFGVLKIGTVLLAMLLTVVLRTDYSEKGIFMIFLFYTFYQNRRVAALSVAGYNLALSLWQLGSVQGAAALSAVPILCYNGKEGKKMKYFFYLFYPVHLLLLHVISLIV